jgi:hypothetical protein
VLVLVLQEKVVQLPVQLLPTNGPSWPPLQAVLADHKVCE